MRQKVTLRERREREEEKERKREKEKKRTRTRKRKKGRRDRERESYRELVEERVHIFDILLNVSVHWQHKRFLLSEFNPICDCL